MASLSPLWWVPLGGGTQTQSPSDPDINVYLVSNRKTQYLQAYTDAHTHTHAISKALTPPQFAHYLLQTFGPVRKTCSTADKDRESDEEDCPLALSRKRG